MLVIAYVLLAAPGVPSLPLGLVVCQYVRVQCVRTFADVPPMQQKLFLGGRCGVTGWAVFWLCL